MRSPVGLAGESPGRQTSARRRLFAYTPPVVGRPLRAGDGFGQKSDHSICMSSSASGRINVSLAAERNSSTLGANDGEAPPAPAIANDGRRSLVRARERAARVSPEQLSAGVVVGRAGLCSPAGQLRADQLTGQTRVKWKLGACSKR